MICLHPRPTQAEHHQSSADGPQTIRHWRRTVSKASVDHVLSDLSFGHLTWQINQLDVGVAILSQDLDTHGIIGKTDLGLAFKG